MEPRDQPTTANKGSANMIFGWPLDMARIIDLQENREK
jgi:hypothetical protein